MNTRVINQLEALRLQLEMTLHGATDKYVPPSFVPANELPYFKRDVPLPDNFHELTADLLQMPSDAEMFAQRLQETLKLAEACLKTARDVNNRKGQFDWVKKGTADAEKTYGEAVKVLNRLISDMNSVLTSVKKASDEHDKISRGTGHLVYPKGKP